LIQNCLDVTSNFFIYLDILNYFFGNFVFIYLDDGVETHAASTCCEII
jgi:hypothetical protein